MATANYVRLTTIVTHFKTSMHVTKEHVLNAEMIATAPIQTDQLAT